MLIQKLEKYGIRGVVLEWSKSYMKNRQQFVQMGDYISTCLDMTVGMPQGSVLGPQLFLFVSLFVFCT